MKEFNLSEKRKEIEDLIIKMGWQSDIEKLIIDKIKEQDKEFIKNEEFLLMQVETGEITWKEFYEKRQKLVGCELSQTCSSENNSQRKKDNDDTRNIHCLEPRSKNRGRPIKNECMSVDADNHADTNIKREKHLKNKREQGKRWYKKHNGEHKERTKNNYRKNFSENPELNKEKYNKNKNKDWYKDSHRKSVGKWNKENPKKRKAQLIAQEKIKIGEGYLCDLCKKELATERHHEDYDKPLEVMLVCKNCHKNKHTLRGSKKKGCGKELFEHPNEIELKAYCGDSCGYFCEECSSAKKDKKC